MISQLPLLTPTIHPPHSEDTYFRCKSCITLLLSTLQRIQISFGILSSLLKAAVSAQFLRVSQSLSPLLLRFTVRVTWIRDVYPSLKLTFLLETLHFPLPPPATPSSQYSLQYPDISRYQPKCVAVWVLLLDTFLNKHQVIKLFVFFTEFRKATL